MTTIRQAPTDLIDDVLRQVETTLRAGEARVRELLDTPEFDHRAAEAELRKSLAELAESRASITAQMDSLKLQNTLLEDALRRAQSAAEATAAKSEFLANMSHEIRTPMTAILGFADVLSQNVTDADCHDAIETIKRNGEYLLEIINDILDLSKIEAGRFRVENIACSPIAIVADIVGRMKVRSEAKKLALDVEYVGQIPETIHTDPTRMRQALLNLVGNAIKFTESGGVRIRVSLETNGALQPCLRFDVADTGIGMTKAELGRLFRPFTQADSSMARRFGGTGLGLTISKRLVEMLGGSLSVRSDAGQGSVFTMAVATGSLDGVTMFEISSQCPLERRSTEPPNEENRPLSCRVLLAEDGPDNRRLITYMLKKAGAEVEIAENGLLAYERIMGPTTVAPEAGSDRPLIDVVLMDMQMPVLDGYEATRRLRESNFDGPIIALTAHAMPGDRERCLAAGCTEYATKPVDRRKLIQLVSQLVGQGAGGK